ncbi:hypothetical protein, partial [Sutterella wadsworthensis]|uniref:hypothetical protein n=2 Tax=Sutterellaceae TaxID=995019 RepID=UPI003A915870
GFRVASGFILFSRLTHLQMPYAVSVRQVSGLPPASFRSRLAADTLALGYVLGATPCTRDFHPLERAHAERTKKLRGELLPRAATMSGRLFGFKPVFVFIVFSYF